jgi:hypothetical protein
MEPEVSERLQIRSERATGLLWVLEMSWAELNVRAELELEFESEPS